MPYRYRDDIAIADVAVEAWGGTLEDTFAAAARATLGAMLEDPGMLEDRERRDIRIEHEELELLLYKFLQEIVFLKDAEGLFVLPRRLAIDGREGGYVLTAELSGEFIDPARHAILTDVKAVTLHHLEVIRDGSGGWIARVILDV